MAYELIYYGNGPIMNDIIAAVNYVLNSADYSTLLQLVLTLAGLFMITGYARGHAERGLSGLRLMGTLALVATLYYGAYSPKVDVVIYDPINAFNNSVRNVPLGTAMILWVSNRIDNGFADLFDKAFTASGFPDEFTYQQTGGVPSSILTVTSLGKVYPSTSYLLISIENYLHDCWTTAAMLGKVDYDAIYQSTDILTTMGNTNLSSAWTTTYYDVTHPTGEVLSCSDAYNAIVSAVNNDASVTGGAMANFAERLKQLGVAGINGTVDASNILQTAASFEFNAGYTSQQLIAQAMLINALNPALEKFATNTGVPASALSAALTESALQTNTTMATSYALASVFLPMSFLVVQSFIIALLPLIFTMMFIPSLTRKYGMMALDLFMWVAFWGPIASIINFIVQEYSRYSMTHTIGSNITYQTMPFLVAHGQTLTAVAGDLMFSVPILAFALASGSAYAMTQVAGVVSGLSRGAAATASRKIATDEGAYSQMTDATNLEKVGKLEQEGYSPESMYMGAADAAAANMAIMTNWIRRAGFKTAVTGGTRNALENTFGGIGMGSDATAEAIGRQAGAEKAGKAEEIEKWANRLGMTGTQLAESIGAMRALREGVPAGAIMSSPELKQKFISSVQESSLESISKDIRTLGALKSLGYDIKNPESLEKALEHIAYGDKRGFDLSAAQAKRVFGIGHPVHADLNYLPEKGLVMANLSWTDASGTHTAQAYYDGHGWVATAGKGQEGMEATRYLTAAEAAQYGLKGAGQYVFDYASNGQLVRVVGKGGADVWQTNQYGQYTVDRNLKTGEIVYANTHGQVGKLLGQLGIRMPAALAGLNVSGNATYTAGKGLEIKGTMDAADARALGERLIEEGKTYAGEALINAAKSGAPVAIAATTKDGQLATLKVGQGAEAKTYDLAETETAKKVLFGDNIAGDNVNVHNISRGNISAGNISESTVKLGNLELAVMSKPGTRFFNAADAQVKALVADPHRRGATIMELTNAVVDLTGISKAVSAVHSHISSDTAKAQAGGSFSISNLPFIGPALRAMGINVGVGASYATEGKAVRQHDYKLNLNDIKQQIAQKLESSSDPLATAHDMVLKYQETYRKLLDESHKPPITPPHSGDKVFGAPLEDIAPVNELSTTGVTSGASGHSAGKGNKENMEDRGLDVLKKNF